MIKVCTTYLTLIILLLKCGGTHVGNPDDDGKNQNTINPDESKIIVYLTDAPVDDFKEVWVKIAKISLLPATESTQLQDENEQEWINITLLEQEPINILDYQNGELLQLAEDQNQVIPGTYKSLRVILDESFAPYGINLDNRKVQIKTSSTMTSGIKINIDFEIKASADQPVEIILDFDLRQSLTQSGQHYKLSPVIHAIEKNSAKSYEGEGKISSAEKSQIETLVCIYHQDQLTIDAIDNQCTDSIQSVFVKNSKFKFSYLASGNYVIVYFDEQGDLLETEEITIP